MPPRRTQRAQDALKKAQDALASAKSRLVGAQASYEITYVPNNFKYVIVNQKNGRPEKYFQPPTDVDILQARSAVSVAQGALTDAQNLYAVSHERQRSGRRLRHGSDNARAGTTWGSDRAGQPSGYAAHRTVLRDGDCGQRLWEIWSVTPPSSRSRT